MVAEKEEISFTDKVVDKVIDRLSEQSPKKRFSLFSSKKSPLPIKLDNSKAKKGYAVVVVLRNNGNLDIQKLPIIDSMIRLKGNDTFHLAEADYIWRYKKYPVIIQPEFSSEPIRAGALAKETREDGKGVDAQTFIIKAIEMANLQPPKKKGGGGKIFLFAIIGIVVLYIIIQYVTKGHL
jgi:hypothetical protein